MSYLQSFKRWLITAVEEEVVVAADEEEGEEAEVEGTAEVEVDTCLGPMPLEVVETATLQGGNDGADSQDSLPSLEIPDPVFDSPLHRPDRLLSRGSRLRRYPLSLLTFPASIPLKTPRCAFIDLIDTFSRHTDSMSDVACRYFTWYSGSRLRTMPKYMYMRSDEAPAEDEPSRHRCRFSGNDQV